MKNIGIIGAGNVAKIIGKHLNTSLNVQFVYSRTPENSIKAAGYIDCEVLKDLAEMPSVDLLIVAVSDDQIAHVASQLNKTIPVVHTSGSVPIEVFSDFNSFGVVYPLQTFGGKNDLNISEIPFLLEASSKEFEAELSLFISQNLSQNVLALNSSKRKQIHLAAVFACNFVTQMFVEAQHILGKSEIDWKILVPLIEETVSKSAAIGPKNALTGPARRGDEKVIAEHLNLLDGPEKLIYELISKRISSNF